MTKCIVSVKDAADRDQIENEIISQGGSVLDKPAAIPVVIIADITEGLFRLLEKDNRLSFIEWESFGSVSVVQNITINDNYGLDRIDQRQRPLNNNYTYVRSGFNTDVYVFDSGINYDHIEFTGRAFPLFDGVNDVDFPNGQDSNGHGTHVSAIIAGITYGVAKQAKLYSVKVGGSSGRVSSIDILNGSTAVISDHLAKSGIRHSVANMSFNFYPRNQTVELATESLIDAGIVVVNSAGNRAINAEEESPTYLEDVLAVGAIDSVDQFASFSNYGEKVNVFAPGVSILSASPFTSESSVVTYESPTPLIVGTVPAGTELRGISIRVDEAFDGQARMRVGFINTGGAFFSVFSLSQSNLATQGYTEAGSVNSSFSMDIPVVVLLETIIPSTQGRVTVEYFTNKISNSKNIRRNGTSQAAPHCSGVVALRLEEEPAKLTTRAEVQAINQFIVDASTKNEIRNFSQSATNANTPNRILFSPWSKSDVVEWITEEGELASLDEGLPLSSVFVEATYFNLIGLETNEVSYSIPNPPTWGGVEIQIDSVTGEITWNGSPPFVEGNETRSFVVRADSTNPQTSFEGAESTFSITVLDVPNEPPVWVNPPRYENPARGHVTALPDAEENVVYTPFDLHAIDPESGLEVDNYSILTGTLPPGLVLDGVTGVISGTPTSGILVSETYEFVIRTVDVLGGITDRTFSIFLLAQEVSPVWVTPAGSIGIANINSPYTFLLEAIDVDGDPVFYNLIAGSLPSGLTLDSNTGLISGTPIDLPGTFSFTVEATDTVLGTIQTFELELQPAFVNNPPTWVTPAGSLGTLDENAPSPFILQAADIEGDPLTFTLNLGPGEEFPPGLSLSSNGVISGIAGSVTVDTTYIFTVDLSDGVNTAVPRTFSITILNVIGVIPPTWVTPAGSLGELWEFYPSTFAVEATDSNDLSITYTVVNGALPSGLSLDPDTGLIVGFPDTIDADTVFDFTIRASNGTLSSDRMFSITILNLTGAAVTKVLADRITGFDRRNVRAFLTDLFSGTNANLLYRVGDPEFAIPQEFDVYMAQGLPILPPGSPIDSNPADEFYRIINDNPRPENPFALQFGKNTDDEHPLDTNEDRDIGGHHYRSKFLLNDLEVHQARDKFTGDVLYDVIVVNIIDPQAGGAFRPDLVTYDSDTMSANFGLVTSQSADGEADPGHAYPPQYPEPFQNDIMQEAIVIHPENDSSYDPSVLNNGSFVNASPDDWTQAIPRNTETLDFITPHSLENMRQHVIEGYGGFVDDIELVPLWMGSEQVEDDPESVVGWKPAAPLAYLEPGTAQDLLDSLTTDQLNYFKGYPIIIDRHLVSTTPVLEPTTIFSDSNWPNGTRFSGLLDTSVSPQGEIGPSFDMGTTTFDDNNPSPGPNDNPTLFDATTFDDALFGIVDDGFLTTFDINNAPLADCTFDMELTTFDGVGAELYNKYIKFPPGDKYWNAARHTIIQKLKKQMPAIDTRES